MGYRAVGKQLQIDEDRANVVRDIFTMRRRRRMGLRAIARQLNERGIVTARGARWYAGTIKYILGNPLYKGNVQYKDESVKRVELALV